ncbi:merozoite surface protein 2-like [Macrosteles quadrilineatus]|uniref:merozoite surface protein 2-like n=1 Tax=Macrosteles quadrilineatus TaxID=74068 RepID=UPI0023E140E3|nr:merozoite surface protein 2-like [Macrosteles quadrilineatus]
MSPQALATWKCDGCGQETASAASARVRVVARPRTHASVGPLRVTHRLPAPRKKSFPPSIVAQFVSRSTRAEWMEAARDNPIQTTDVAASLRRSPVLLIDHLTPRNRRLLEYAKTIVKEGRLAYAWSKEGKIKIRKTPDGPVKTIRDNSEVDEFAGPAVGGGVDTVVSGNGGTNSDNGGTNSGNGGTNSGNGGPNSGNGGPNSGNGGTNSGNGGTNSGNGGPNSGNGVINSS